NGAVRAGLDEDAAAVVSGDDVALSRRDAANRVDAGVAVDVDPERIEDRRRTGRVQADVVALNLGASCAGPNLDARPVTGDHVPRKTRTADDRPLGADDIDADPAVGDPPRPRRIRADEV